MNSCDFCLASYSFDNVTGDLALDYFDTHVTHDAQQMIPLIQAAMKRSSSPLRLFLTPWSPPAWMKTNGQMTQTGIPVFTHSMQHAHRTRTS
jgi:glucosylceramidase